MSCDAVDTVASKGGECALETGLGLMIEEVGFLRKRHQV